MNETRKIKIEIVLKENISEKELQKVDDMLDKIRAMDMTESIAFIPIEKELTLEFSN